MQIDKKELFDNLNKKYNLNTDHISSLSSAIYSCLASILNCKVDALKTKCKLELSKEDLEKLEKMLNKLVYDKIPLQYLTHKVNIYNEEYIVDENVLIPRQDTETLIEESIRIINRENLKSMLDICTGSGVVGISVAKNSCVTSIDFLDISSEALGITRKNIEHNKMLKNHKIICSNLFEKLYGTNEKYDIIVTNPPYISSTEYEKLSDYVKKEPIIALVGKDDGFEFYKRIANDAKKFLSNNGFLCMEIGYMQGSTVLHILKENGYTDISVVKDINNNDRVVVCRFQNK